MIDTQLINSNIISEFEKLVNFIQLEIDSAKEKKDIKLTTANTFRLKQVKNALITIKKYPKQITISNLNEFGEFPGIGKGTIDRIKEIIQSEKLEEIANFKDTFDENKKILEELELIVGVGRVGALKLIKEGVQSVDDLKKKIDLGEIDVNDKVKLGVKYYGKFKGDIPRKEIDKIYKIFEYIIKKMNTKYKLTDENKYIFEICGSYRREKLTCGDIDVLISKVGTFKKQKENNNTDTDNDTNNDTDTDNDTDNHLLRVVEILKKKIKLNDNKPLILDDMTDKNFTTKYMGFSQYKSNPIRRIDIRFVQYDVYFPALLYFTGSAELNVKMRKIAKSMNLKLSEYGLTNEDGTQIPINSEYDFFKILKIEYLPPKLR